MKRLCETCPNLWLVVQWCNDFHDRCKRLWKTENENITCVSQASGVLYSKTHCHNINQDLQQSDRKTSVLTQTRPADPKPTQRENVQNKALLLMSSTAPLKFSCSGRTQVRLCEAYLILSKCQTHGRLNVLPFAFT